MCDGVNSSRAPMSEVWWSGPWSQAGRDSCAAGWIVRWDSLNQIPSFSFGREGGVGAQLAAPAGTSFDYVRADSNVGSQGGGARCTGFFRGDGSLIDGTQNCRAPSYSWGYTGWQGRASSFVGTDRVYLLGFCTYGPCNIGPQGGFQAEIKNIVVRINDSTAPSLVDGSGLWATQKEWVRGTWPVGFSASDGMGIKQSSASLQGTGEYSSQVIESQSQDYCSPAFNGSVYYGASTHPCPGSAGFSGSLDTSRIGDGVKKLTLWSKDTTSNRGRAEREVKIDNSAPLVQSLSIPEVISASTFRVPLEASDPQSGISGYQCKLDSGSYEACSKSYSSPALSVGAHSFCFRAANNSFDVNGNANLSSEVCRSFTYTPPAPATTPVKPAPIGSGDGSGAKGGADSVDGSVEQGYQACLAFGEEQDDSQAISVKLSKKAWVRGSVESDGSLSLTRSSAKLRLSLSSEGDRIPLSGKGKRLSGSLEMVSGDYSLLVKLGKKTARANFSASADGCE